MTFHRVYVPIYISFLANYSTYDHRILNSALPVRSAVLKQDTGGLVVRWVTTSESPLLYVFFALLFVQAPSRGRYLSSESLRNTVNSA
ncbi:uncharacterized protein K460DRAFT_4777 [Cucurbitaria berberidis CBS 394.84]|uniref:Uncharacterized protein n=1 Tax=Cucurbitaria berberidis CBS 394.84 TaxID=1168544 RepID=A0A9P4GR72_9PLEO|nr:uncharacterized protein K460DRAFT_4777 [Cucurbitaria berberidis CBS 394.84]KAF1849852.1 hypothetical protein K460DRAFT_4777 [Cucurbitaria berberidis CBS 394.84]